MKKMYVCTALLTALAFTSCDQLPGESTKPDLDQIKSDIQALEDEFARALIDKDAEAIAALYAEDMIVLPNEKPMMDSKEEMLADMKKDFAEDSTRLNIRFEVLDVMAEDDLVIETGKSVSTLADGKEREGKYLVVWKKTGDTYKVLRDIGNSNQSNCDSDTKED